MSGVAVIATSSLPLLRDFGIVVGMNVAVALLSALVVLPPMLVWADKRGWVSQARSPTTCCGPPRPGLRGKRAIAPTAPTPRRSRHPGWLSPARLRPGSGPGSR